MINKIDRVHENNEIFETVKQEPRKMTSVEPKPTEPKKFNFFLYFAVITANIAGFSLGATFAWSSPVLPKLNGKLDPEENPLERPVTPYEETWIASLLPLGSAISCFLFGYLADRIGRKRTLLLSMLPSLVGFALNAFATNVLHYYIGRFLNGLGCGAVFTIIPIYVGEISENSNRGILGCLFVVFINLGNVFSYALGPYVSVQVLSLCLGALPLIFLVTFGLLVPETPYYLIAKNQPEKAEESLLKLRYGNAAIVKAELPEITRNVEKSLAKKGGIKDLFGKKDMLRAFWITAGLIVFQQISGSNFIFFYMQSLFQESGNIIPSDLAVIIVSSFRFAASVLSSSLVDRLGRRILLLSSALGTAVALISFGVYFLLKDNGVDVTPIYWLPMVSLIFFVIFFAFGFGPVPYTILGEMFPTHVKSVASSFTICICLGFMFCVTNFFPLLVTVTGMAYTFFILSACCCVGGIFTYVFLPETKGKSLQEIQDLLKK